MSVVHEGTGRTPVPLFAHLLAVFALRKNIICRLYHASPGMVVLPKRR